MCVSCGCGNAAERPVTVEGEAVDHEHGATNIYQHHHFDADSGARLIRIEKELLDKNSRIAEANRLFFSDNETFVINLLSSPGSGKTALLARTAKDLNSHFPIAVIEGDQQTSTDAERVREAGVPAIQINTGKVCHLDAHMIRRAVKHLDVSRHGVLFIENVGNLVCPAEFDLGEDHKVVVMSVTEGEDKPLKYPQMFAAADLMLLNKTDLLPYLVFDVNRCVEFARRVNPSIEIFEISATSGLGLPRWYDWIERRLKGVKARPDQGRSAR